MTSYSINLLFINEHQCLESSLHTLPYLPTFESQKTEHAILRGSEATKPEGGKLPRGGGGGGGGCGRGVWEGGVPPPTVGSFCIFGLQIVQSGAYLERKFRLKIYCIAWKATNLKIPKTERSVFWGFKNFKNRTVGKSALLVAISGKPRASFQVVKNNPCLKGMHKIWIHYRTGLLQGLKAFPCPFTLHLQLKWNL